MKTMQDYTNFCTEEQTRRAYKLGAPIVEVDSNNDNASPIQMKPDDRHSGAYWFKWVETPTTQQMISWLREKKKIVLFPVSDVYQISFVGVSAYKEEDTFFETKRFKYYNEAELAAIDAALDYLEKQSK